MVTDLPKSGYNGAANQDNILAEDSYDADRNRAMLQQQARKIGLRTSCTGIASQEAV